MKQTTYERQISVPAGPISRSQWLFIGSLLIVDLLVVAATFLLAFYLRKDAPYLPQLAETPETYLSNWPIVLVWPFMLWREGLYPGLQWIGSEYLRRIATATTMASVLVMAITYLTKTGPQYSRPLVAGFWLLTLATLPLARLGLRSLFNGLGIGGPRAVVLGAGKSAALVVSGLKAQQPSSLMPVAAFDDDVSKQGDSVEGVPIVGTLDDVKAWARAHRVRVAIVAMPGIDTHRLINIIEEQSKCFPRLLIVPNLFGLSTVDVSTRDIGGTLTLEMRKNLLSWPNRALKRLSDFVLVILLGIPALPVLVAIAMAALLESGRPVFFVQRRVGFQGSIYSMFKFRTMVANADELLAAKLAQDPELKREWQRHQKLADDPRLTRVGALLRRLSLDELPQLWNVVRGEMSVVGPRPITEHQVELYGPSIHLYKQVRPGLTGLWQVSGRAATSFEERVEMDTYYVRNWSVWLDAIIAVKTIWAIVSGQGAY